MKISYLLTCSTETNTLSNVLDRLDMYLNDDELIILLDSNTINNDETKNILNKFLSTSLNKNIKLITHGLEKSYSNHKNFGLNHCHNEYIFQCDADELPTELLLINLKEIIKVNPDIDAVFISRINDYIGVDANIAAKWGWRLSPSTTITHEKMIDIYSNEYRFLKLNNYIINETINNYGVFIKYKAVLVNPYDHQCRLFKNKPEIKWFGNLHERITGNKNFVYLPDENESLALYHDKSIQKQIQTNVRYNEDFSESDNKGFTLPG